MMINVLWGVIQVFNSCEGNEEHSLSRGSWKHTIILVRSESRSRINLRPISYSSLHRSPCLISDKVDLTPYPPCAICGCFIPLTTRTHSPLHNSPSLSAVGSLLSCSGEGHCHLAERCPSAPVRRHLVSAVKLAENSPGNREHYGNWKRGVGPSWVQTGPSSWRSMAHCAAEGFFTCNYFLACSGQRALRQNVEPITYIELPVET